MLATEKEILVTRDSKPVARLVRYEEPVAARKKFDPVTHGRWQERQGGKVRLVEKYLEKDREDR